MNPESEWITVALLGRTRGNHGELTAIALSKPERYAELHEVFLFPPGSRHELESAWWHDNRLILKFRGVDSIDAAEVLAGAEVRIRAAARVTLEPGEYFESDLIGCQVVERSGAALGRVTGWQDTGGVGLLELEGGLLIPFARSICVAIHPTERRIVVELPEGLKDLNRV